MINVYVVRIYVVMAIATKIVHFAVIILNVSAFFLYVVNVANKGIGRSR